MIHPGSYYEDNEARAQDINGFHKLDNLNHNVQERKNFISSNKQPGSQGSQPSNKPVRSATGKASMRR
jgi:hypothetical protein